jgi:hypothetical protein
MAHAPVLCGYAYVAAYLGWARIFHRRVEPLARAALSRAIGRAVEWGPASTFPLPIRAWAVSGSAGARTDAAVAIACVGLSFSAALLPVFALCAVTRWTERVPGRVSEALYLITIPLVVAFVVSSQRNAPAPREALRDSTTRLERPSRFPRGGLS